MSKSQGLSHYAKLRIVLFTIGLLWPCVAGADDFRIASKVFVGKAKDPSSENLTLFRAGIVYDYLVDADQVAVFDQPHGKFILLDTQRRVKTEITQDQLLAGANDLHDLLAKASGPLAKFQADPKFDISDGEANELKFASAQWNYRVVTAKPAHPEVAEQCREFSDWYARLNAMTSPRSNPPFARLIVNAELAKRGVVASRVYLDGGRGVSLHSEHDMAWKLLPKDHDRITETGNQVVTYQLVSLSEYQKAEVAKK